MPVLRNVVATFIAGTWLVSAASGNEHRSLRIAPGIERPELRRLQLPDLYVPKAGVNCPYGASLVATGPDVTTPFIVRLSITSFTEGAWLHRRTFDVKVPAVSAGTFVKFPFSKSMLGSDTSDLIRCSIYVDLAKQVTETDEKNNTTIRETYLLGNDERQ